MRLCEDYSTPYEKAEPLGFLCNRKGINPNVAVTKINSYRSFESKEEQGRCPAPLRLHPDTAVVPWLGYRTAQP